MDYIKEAFQKVKQDIELLKKENDFFRSNLKEAKEQLINLCEIIKKLNEKIEVLSKKQQNQGPTQTLQISAIPTYIPADKLPFSALKDKNMLFSIGNEGVPTDRQTDRQTDQQRQKTLEKQENSIDNAVEILNSLDNIKKDIRLKFKRLTEQELLVFSAIYQLDEETDGTNYRELSKRLNLTESSVRDYVGKIIKKGIPVEKKRVNNKNISLSISKNLKKIASLSTILQLRSL